MVGRLFLAVPWGCLRFVIVVFPDHTHLLFTVCCVFSGGCMISPGTEKSLLVSAKLIGVDKEELREALVSRVMQATRGGVKGTAIK